MILYCSFEELTALDAAIERVRGHLGIGAIAAPPDVLPDLEALAPRLSGDIDIESLTEQESIQRAIEYLLHESREHGDAMIVDQHPAAEDAVAAYFTYAHILSVLDRVRHMGAQMRALIELMTGDAPSDEDAASLSFED
jgi:hypothetical protein